MSAAAPVLPHWDMAVFFPGLASPEFEQACVALTGHCADLAAFFDHHGIDARDSREIDDQIVLALESALHRLNTLAADAQMLQAYVTSFVTTDSRDLLAQARQSELQRVFLRVTLLSQRFRAWVGSFDVEAVITRSEMARDHAYFLRTAYSEAQHQMTPPEEALAAELSLTGSAAWSRMRETLSSTIAVSIEGVETALPISAVRNLSHHHDRTVRRRSYQAELKAWEGDAHTIAAALNAIKGEVITLAARRGWESPLDAALFENRIDRQTLNALTSATEDALPSFRRYLRAKARLLGLDALAWYDLYAPVGESTTDWQFQEAADLIIQRFGAYSPMLGRLAKRAFDERWIDAEPRTGKRDGAFCLGVQGDVSRILTNFTPGFDALTTLAHELGHAYHNLQLARRTMLQRAVPMTLAETASTFCETIVQQAGLAVTSGAAHLALLDASLQGSTAIVVDVFGRFLFEKRVFEARRARDLSVGELNQLMLQSERETYGDGLDCTILHPYMWAVKSHYYSAELSFYNFPYMFGLLFGLGLHAHYQLDPERFRDGYDDLLSLSGMIDPATLALRFGIDVRSPQFWRESLAVIEARIDDFERLASGSGVHPA